MKKRLLVIPVILVLMFNFFSSLSVSAYAPSSGLYNIDFVKYGSAYIHFDSNGVLLHHYFVRTKVEVDRLPLSDRILNNVHFSSGTWQGRDISDLSSPYLIDQSDTFGFSQSVSISLDGSSFVYSVLTCLPCVAGDTFYITNEFNSYVTDMAYRERLSILPGVTGIKKVYRMSNANYTDSPLSYTTKSDNQHLISLFTSSNFGGNDSGPYLFSPNNQDYLVSDSSNVTRIVSRMSASIYTSNYGLSSGTVLSLRLKENTRCWDISVYELLSDGTFYPGFDDGSSGDDSDLSSGSADLSKIEKLLQDIIAIISGFDFHAPDPHEFWEVYKSGLVELFGLEGSEPEKPPPEASGDSDPEGSTEDQLTFEIDEDQFNSAMDYVDIDNLDESLTGYHGAIAFFWHFSNRFFESLDLYPIIALSLIFCLATWLLRS